MTEWINYHSHNRHLFVPPTQGVRPMTEAERIKELEARVAELEAALTEAKTPSHFVDWSDEGSDFCTDIESVIESAIYDTPPGLHLFEVMTFRQCPTVWAVVHCLTEDEREALGADTDWTLTECATEAEARALLKEPDQ